MHWRTSVRNGWQASVTHSWCVDRRYLSRYSRFDGENAVGDGRESAEKRSDILQSTRFLRGVHYSCVRRMSSLSWLFAADRLELNCRITSRKAGHEVGYCLIEFQFERIWPFSGFEKCPYEAARSVVRSKTSIKKPIYIHVVSYLKSRVRMVDARAFKQSIVPHHGRLFLTNS